MPDDLEGVEAGNNTLAGAPIGDWEPAGEGEVAGDWASGVEVVAGVGAVEAPWEWDVVEALGDVEYGDGKRAEDGIWGVGDKPSDGDSALGGYPTGRCAFEVGDGAVAGFGDDTWGGFATGRWGMGESVAGNGNDSSGDWTTTDEAMGAKAGPGDDALGAFATGSWM